MDEFNKISWIVDKNGHNPFFMEIGIKYFSKFENCNEGKKAMENDGYTIQQDVLNVVGLHGLWRLARLGIY